MLLNCFLSQLKWTGYYPFSIWSGAARRCRMAVNSFRVNFHRITGRPVTSRARWRHGGAARGWIGFSNPRLKLVAEPDETLFAFISGFAWLFICFNKERIELLIESSEFEGFFFWFCSFSLEFWLFLTETRWECRDPVIAFIVSDFAVLIGWAMGAGKVMGFSVTSRGFPTAWLADTAVSWIICKWVLAPAFQVDGARGDGVTGNFHSLWLIRGAGGEASGVAMSTLFQYEHLKADLETFETDCQIEWKELKWGRVDGRWQQRRRFWFAVVVEDAMESCSYFHRWINYVAWFIGQLSSTRS